MFSLKHIKKYKTKPRIKLTEKKKENIYEQSTSMDMQFHRKKTHF